jgi:aldose sugar dehydrogenase
MTMKTPVALVTATLTAAILLAVTFLIATGTRGEDALPPADTGARTVPTSPASK